MKINRRVKIVISVLLAVVLAVFIFYIGRKKVESVKKQSSNLSNDMQSKLDEQQKQIDELQKYKDSQQQQEEQSRKTDCEARLQKQQDSLAAVQRRLGSDQEFLKEAEAGICNSYDCYKNCLKSYGCTSESSCNKSSVNNCKRNHADWISTEKSAVAEDTSDVNWEQSKLDSIKNECAQYLNN